MRLPGQGQRPAATHHTSRKRSTRTHGPGYFEGLPGFPRRTANVQLNRNAGKARLRKWRPLRTFQQEVKRALRPLQCKRHEYYTQLIEIIKISSKARLAPYCIAPACRSNAKSCCRASPSSVSERTVELAAHSLIEMPSLDLANGEAPCCIRKTAIRYFIA